MAYDPINKRVCIDTSTTPHTGVSINDVKTCLNESSNDLGTLCKSNSINHFSAVKPVRSSDVTVTDFAELNYGFNCDAEEMTGTIDEISQAVFNASTDPEWEGKYEKPRGVDYNEWYRLLDFNEYRHLSSSPVSATKPASSITNSSASYSLVMDSDANMMKIHLMDAIENWSAAGDKDDLRYVLVKNTTPNKYIVGPAVFNNSVFNGTASFTISNITPEIQNNVCVVIAPCVYENGQYILVGASTQEPQMSEGDTPAMYLPSTYCSFYRVGPHTGLSITAFSAWADDASVTEVSWQYTIQNNSGYRIRLAASDLRIELGYVIYDEVYDQGGHIVKSGYTVMTEGDSSTSDSGAGVEIPNGGSLVVTGSESYTPDEDNVPVVLALSRVYTTEYDNYSAQHTLAICGSGDWDEYHATEDFEYQVEIPD